MPVNYSLRKTWLRSVLTATIHFDPRDIPIGYFGFLNGIVDNFGKH